MGKTLGQMTPAERAATARRAAAQFQAELERNAGAIGRILEGAGAAPQPEITKIFGTTPGYLGRYSANRS